MKLLYNTLIEHDNVPLLCCVLCPLYIFFEVYFKKFVVDTFKQGCQPSPIFFIFNWDSFLVSYYKYGNFSRYISCIWNHLSWTLKYPQTFIKMCLFHTTKLVYILLFANQSFFLLSEHLQKNAISGAWWKRQAWNVDRRRSTILILTFFNWSTSTTDLFNWSTSTRLRFSTGRRRPLRFYYWSTSTTWSTLDVDAVDVHFYWRFHHALLIWVRACQRNLSIPWDISFN